MAHHAREKSRIKPRVAHNKKPGALDYGIKIAENTADCGCSLKNFHGSLSSSFAKPTKCKLSQIWPLFRHEFAMPAALKKLDTRGSSNAGGPSLRRGFIRSPSPQQYPRIKSPNLFAGVLMQRDNYVEVSPCKPVHYVEEEHHDKVHSEDEYDDFIPMGTIVCTAKGSPCCTDNLHCREESGNDDLDDVEVDNETSDKLVPNKEVRSRFGAPKQLRSTSPRSDNLYTAVEREFKRLGIYKDKDCRAPAYPRNEEKHLSPCHNKSMENKLLEFSSQNIEIKDHAFSLQQPVEEERPMPLDVSRQHCRDFERIRDQAITPEDYQPPEHNNQQSVLDQQEHYGYYHDGSYDNQQYEDKTQAILQGGHLSGDTRISHNNAMESFVSLSNALCVTHFSTVIKKAEASIQRFTNYLIKARQRMMMRENPSQAPAHKHDITASMIRAMMPNMKFDSRHHLKYGLQACISKVIFDQFDTHNYGGEEEISYKINRQFMFLRAYYVLEALDNCNGEQLMEINGEFQQFCHRKLEAMKRRVGWESRWPSKLLQAFLFSLKDVWVAHKLAFAFEKPASIFFAKPRSPLHLEHMNPLMESASSKLSPNPKYMSPLMESSFTKLRPSPNPKYMSPLMESRFTTVSPNPHPNLERVDRNKTSYYMSPLREYASFNTKKSPNPNPSPNSNLSPNPNLSPSSSPNLSPNLNLSPNPNFSPNACPSWNKGNRNLAAYVELKQISLRWHGVVQFTVFPGFFLKEDGVVHSIVYLQPKTPCVPPLNYPHFLL